MLEDALSHALAKSGMALDRLSLAVLGRALIALSLTGVTASAAFTYLPRLELPAMPSLPAMTWNDEAPDPAVPVVVLAPLPSQPAVAVPAAPVASAAIPVAATPAAPPLVRGPMPAERPRRAPTGTQRDTATAPAPDTATAVTFTTASAPAPAVIAALAEPDAPVSGATEPGARPPAAIQTEPERRPVTASPQASRTAASPRKRSASKTGLSPNKAAKLFFRDLQRALNNF